LLNNTIGLVVSPHGYVRLEWALSLKGSGLSAILSKVSAEPRRDLELLTEHALDSSYEWFLYMDADIEFGSHILGAMHAVAADEGGEAYTPLVYSYTHELGKFPAVWQTPDKLGYDDKGERTLPVHMSGLSLFLVRRHAVEAVVTQWNSAFHDANHNVPYDQVFTERLSAHTTIRLIPYLRVTHWKPLPLTDTAAYRLAGYT
jgi:hypothetical protein